MKYWHNVTKKSNSFISTPLIITYYCYSDCIYITELILADRLAKREIIKVEQDIIERQQMLGIPPIDGRLHQSPISSYYYNM